MAETTLDQNTSSQSISRRSFLKLFGLGTLALTIPPSLLLGIEQLTANEDHAANLALLADIKLGKFTGEKIGQITSLGDLHQNLSEKTKELKGVSRAHIFVTDGANNKSIEHNTSTHIFLPASTIKIPICYEAWKIGQEIGKNYLTPELAKDILEISSDFINLLMSLPIAQGKKPEQLEAIVRDLITKAGIPPANNLGELPLKVDIRDQFNYLNRMKLPQVMKDAMLQEAQDHDTNYGVSTVLLQNTHRVLPAYFKIGLINDETKHPTELVNSYYFQLGDKIKMLGYAQGTNYYEVHKQMLFAAAYIGSFAAHGN